MQGVSGWDDHCARNETSTGFNCSICAAYGKSGSAGEQGQKQSHYLNSSSPTCLDRQDLHPGFSAGAPGQGKMGWVEIVVFIGAVGVAALGTGQDSAQVTRRPSGYKITLCSCAPKEGSCSIFISNETQ